LLTKNLVLESFRVDTFCSGEDLNSKKIIDPYQYSRGLTAPLSKNFTPASTFGFDIWPFGPQAAALCASLWPPQLCPGNDPLRNFAKLAGQHPCERQ